MIYDISRPLRAHLAVWPGDNPFEIRTTASISDGDNVNLSSIELSTHCGTHIDAPWHFDAQGERVDELDLSVFIGKARVIELDRLGPIDVDILETFDLEGVERLLWRTALSGQPLEKWPDTLAYPTPEAAAWLGSKGLRLLGNDGPSMDALDSRSLPSHHALRSAGIQILESLCLRAVEPGDYELIALPLRINADGSPVRAVLRTL